MVGLSSTRAWSRRVLLALVLCLFAISGSAVEARAAAPIATLDSSFGSGGIVKLSPEVAFSAAGAVAPDGTLVVSGGSSVRLVSALGGPGEAFGGVGSVSLPTATGAGFVLAGFAVDPRGRLLVVGTVVSLAVNEPSTSSQSVRPSAVRVLRYLPSGTLDQSFGDEGVVETSFGLPAPLSSDGQRIGSRPVVEATAIAVGPSGQIVVTGSALVRFGPLCGRGAPAPIKVSAGYLAEFTDAGASNPGFGHDGLVGGKAPGENPIGAPVIREPLIDRAGRITYSSAGSNGCGGGRGHRGIAQLDADGKANAAFGSKGVIFGSFRSVVEGPEGSLVALEGQAGRNGKIKPAYLARFRADGHLDGSFGKNGRTALNVAGGSSVGLDALVVDGQGRILVGGTLGHGKGGAIVLLRVSAGGQWERRFGPRGRVATKIPHLGEGRPSALFFDPQGRLDTVHLYNEPGNGRSGLIVARYLLRE